MNEFDNLILAIRNLIELDESLLNEDSLKDITTTLNEQFSPVITEQMVNEIVNNFENQGLVKAEAKDSIKALIAFLKEKTYGDTQLTVNKKKLVDFVFGKIEEIGNKAVEKYHSYAIELPMTVDTVANAQIPTFAHDTDAAADLYAIEDQVIPAHSYGNKIRTGVKIQLPEGWLAFIMPRSSIGAKTPLRLSNSIGLIDSGYRGELGILYDNTSDEDYKITAGDRIAQLLVMPSYRFQAKVVDVLMDSDRGEGGFGASGK